MPTITAAKVPAKVPGISTAAARAAALAAEAALEKKRRDAFDIAASLKLRASQIDYTTAKYQGGYSLPIDPFSANISEGGSASDYVFFTLINNPNIPPSVAAAAGLMRALESRTYEATWELSSAIGKSMGLTTAENGFSLPPGRDSGYGYYANEAFVAKVQDIIKQGGINKLISGARISELFAPAAAAALAEINRIDDENRARKSTSATKSAAATATKSAAAVDTIDPAKAAAAAAQGVANAAAAAVTAAATGARSAVNIATEKAAYAAALARSPSLFGGRKPRRISRKKRSRSNKSK